MLGSSVFRLAHWIRSSGALQVLESIRSEPYQPREVVASRQVERLRGLVHYCETLVPFYRRRFREAGIVSEDIRSLADLSRIPVLTKADVTAHGDDLIAEGISRDALLAHHSGGSTGVPLRFYRDAAYLAASDAGTYRNLLQSGWRPGEMIGFFWGWNDRLAAMGRLEFVARQLTRRMYQFDPFRSGERDMARWWQSWRWLRPVVALGYASTIARFARYLEEHSLRARPLRGVFTTAEKLLPAQRELIERVFACHVFDCYGSSEVQNIAAECSRGRMHINADYAVVEVEGAPGGTETPAPLLVTSLKNFAMPFLRYRNEDSGALLDGSCDCGNGFPLMSLAVARLSDNFTLPGGRVVHGEFFTHLMYGSEGVDRFQFHQVAPDAIVLRYVPAGSGDASGVLAAAVAQIEALAPGEIRVRVESVLDIPLSSAGKHRFTRSDVVS